ncbi:MAG: phage portal protein [Phenylobacterium sp.]|nr:phage portal protein [Phenylobacterium sp.]
MADVPFFRLLETGLRGKAAGPPQAVDGSRGWWPLVREAFAGAWQRNVEPVSLTTAASNPVLFRCISLISGDIAKLRCRLMQQSPDGTIWSEVESPAFSPVLRKPNGYQTRVQFFASWVISKLTQGNALILKQRDDRGVVVRLHVLDWNRVTPLVAPDGSVYYACKRDDLAGLGLDYPAIPASEVIHDRWNTLFHPLVGLSPVYACGLAALQAQEIQQTSTKFFRNGSRPGGILTAPAKIDDATAKRLKDHWEENYAGDNMGKVAVLGDGLAYVPMAVTAKDAELIDILKWSGETICGCFGVPAYMAGVGSPQLNNNVQTLAELYYSQCLQIHIESIEACLDEGLGIGYGVKTGEGGKVYGTEFDLDDLLRMDTATQVRTLAEAVKGIMTPDEARGKLGLPKVKGGAAVYMQQQNYSLEALAKRDASEDPFKTVPPAQASGPPVANDDEPTEAEAAKAMAVIWKGLRHVRR